VKELYYPVALKLKDKGVLVVGGGQVAERKVKTLLRFSARIRVVSPDLTVALRRLAGLRRIVWLDRTVKASDVERADLVIAATSDRNLNRRIGRDASRKGIWVNVVDDTAACDFISTAVIRKRGLVISISTGGKNPKLSKAFKDFLKGKLDEFDFNRDKS